MLRPGDTNDSLADFICTAVEQACQRVPASVDVQSSFLDLGMDSLTFVSIVSQVEAVYGVELDTDDLLALFDAPRVGDVVEVLGGLLVRRSRAASTQ